MLVSLFMDANMEVNRRADQVDLFMDADMEGDTKDDTNE